MAFNIAPPNLDQVIANYRNNSSTQSTIINTSISLTGNGAVRSHTLMYRNFDTMDRAGGLLALPSISWHGKPVRSFRYLRTAKYVLKAIDLYWRGKTGSYKVAEIHGQQPRSNAICIWNETTGIGTKYWIEESIDLHEE
ncbi:hypothetical protein BDV96DRAFT_643857 [Lophiotrema nucula]|uniref:Uncharacterized protein n=1 Tax=Lophiotrema nucula TaxID=690887 RepID=A0A6A5ZGK8_9PLEO|nr:hypothetical protein BDV96DRAFT_643857 [Lophiotrema nucula]